MKYKVGDIVRFADENNTYKIIGNGYDGEAKYYIASDERTGNTIRIAEAEHTKLVASCQQVKKDDKQTVSGDKDTVQQVTGKLKLIDILNKIANGELKEGTKVIMPLNGDEYTFFKSPSRYYELENECRKRIFEIYNFTVLSQEVELIEPDHFADVGKMAECKHEWAEYAGYNAKTGETKHYRECVECGLQEEIEDNIAEKIEELDADYYEDQPKDYTIRAIIKKLNEVIRILNKRS